MHGRNLFSQAGGPPCATTINIDKLGGGVARFVTGGVVRNFLFADTGLPKVDVECD